MRLRYLLAGLALVLAFGLVGAPAWVAALAVEALSDGAARLDGPTGSLWSGSARALVLRTPSGVEQRLAGLAWRLLPARLLAGEAAADLRLAGPPAAGQVSVARTLHELRLADARLRLPADTLPAWLPILAFVGPAGQVTATTPLLTGAGRIPEGELDIRWSDATSRLAPGVPLGEWRLTVSGKAGQVAATLEAGGGVLLAAGSGRWSPAAGGEMSGSARAAPGQERAAKPLLDLLGPPEPDGSRVWRLRFPPA